MFVENNENFEVCKACGGNCCKHYGGFLHPSDLGMEEITEKVIRERIDRGDVSIDWYEGYLNKNDKYVNGYFLRMKHKNSEVIDPSYGGECVHLTRSGCDLKFDDRAHGCKTLKPSSTKVCIDGGYTKLECATDWEPYHDIFEKMVSQKEYPISEESTYGSAISQIAKMMHSSGFSHDMSTYTYYYYGDND